MALSKFDDATFIAAWSRLRSPTRVAKELGVSVRAACSRRDAVQLRHGLVLPVSDVRSPNFVLTLPENQKRATLDIDSGVAIVFSDAHYWPGIVTAAHRALVVAVGELKPALIVANGDIFDGAQVSRHGRIGWAKGPSVKDELDAVRDRLAEIEAVAGNAKLHRTIGNHDLRFETRLSGNVPEYEGVGGFTLKDHVPRWSVSMSLMVNGSCMVKHRYHNGVHATWNNALKSGTSIVTGHLHALQVRPFTDYNGTRYAVDTGTLADPTGDQFEYAEDAPSNHRAGFAVLTWRNGRLLPPELLEVIDEEEGLVCFRGQVVAV